MNGPPSGAPWTDVNAGDRFGPPRARAGLAFGGPIAKIAPAVDHLLRRTPADAELKSSACDQIGCACVLDHIKRVFVTHVDDSRSDLDAAGLRTDRSEQREGRSQLASEVMNPEIGTVGAQLLGSDGEFDGLQQRIRGRTGLRLRRGRPMSER